MPDDGEEPRAHIAAAEAGEKLERPQTCFLAHILSVAVGGPSQPSVGVLFIGLQAANIPFAGTLFVPDVLTSVGIGVVGQAYFANFWPATVPPGTTIYLQAWFKTPSGLSASNAWMILSE